VKYELRKDERKRKRESGEQIRGSDPPWRTGKRGRCGATLERYNCKQEDMLAFQFLILSVWFAYWKWIRW
jgi:hypothetical protein